MIRSGNAWSATIALVISVKEIDLGGYSEIRLMRRLRRDLRIHHGTPRAGHSDRLVHLHRGDQTMRRIDHVSRSPTYRTDRQASWNSHRVPSTIRGITTNRPLDERDRCSDLIGTTRIVTRDGLSTTLEPLFDVFGIAWLHFVVQLQARRFGYADHESANRVIPIME